MIDEEPQKEIPIGLGGELNRLTQEKWREHLLLFSQVKNTVLEVNPYIYPPLKLEEGKPSPLGLFAEAAFEKIGEAPSPGKYLLEVWRVHPRSALLGRVVFTDKERRLYRDTDLKGIGLIGEPWGALLREPQVSVPGRKWGDLGRLGLLDRGTALSDYEKSEEFLKAGIRTYRILAIIGLKELVANQRKLSLKEAIKEGIIDKRFHPAIEVRAFGTKLRIEDFYSESEYSENDVELLLDDARKLVSQELGRKEPLSEEEYLSWFAKTLGENVGSMHKNGWYHRYLSPHNITLDCRIVDLDSIVQLRDEVQREKDLYEARSSFWALLTSLNINRSKIEPLREQVEKSYNSVFPPEERERYFNRVSKEK